MVARKNSIIRDIESFIPVEWTIEILGDISDVRDGTHDSPKYIETGYPLITSKNLKPRGLDFSNVNYISTEDHQEISKRSKVETGDILFGMIGTIGNPVVVSKEDGEFSIKNVALIKFNNDNLNNIYMKHLLNSNFIERVFQRISDGGVQKFISLGTIRKLPIPTPPLKEQQKIAAILSSVDEAIEKTEQIIEQTETVKKGLVQQLLTKGTEHMEFKNSPIGVIPKSWSVKPLEDLVIEKPSYGSGNSAQDYDINKPRYIRITDITEDGYLNENEPKSVEYKGNESYLLKDGDFLFARTGNTVGKSYMYQEKDGFAVYAGYLIRFRVNKSIIKPKFIFHLTHSNYYYNWVKSMIRTGAQPNINAQEYSSFLIPIPSIEEQDHIINIFSKFEEKIFSEQQQLEVLENIKKGLMQQLLTGKVRVQIDENEEIPS